MARGEKLMRLVTLGRDLEAWDDFRPEKSDGIWLIKYTGQKVH